MSAEGLTSYQKSLGGGSSRGPPLCLIQCGFSFHLPQCCSQPHRLTLVFAPVIWPLPVPSVCEALCWEPLTQRFKTHFLTPEARVHGGNHE